MKKLLRDLKKKFRSKIYLIISDFKKPRMIRGYNNCDGTLHLRTRISDTTYMYHPERINISDNVFVGHYTLLDGTGGIDIGEGTQLAAYAGIFTHSSHIAIRLYGKHYLEIPENDKVGFLIDQVKIGNYVFIGAGSKILPGVTIGDGALVSAGAIVNIDIEPFQMVAGNPARVIGDTRDLDEKFLNDPQLKKWYFEWQQRDT